jgi:hypothetical protein
MSAEPDGPAEAPLRQTHIPAECCCSALYFVRYFGGSLGSWWCTLSASVRFDATAKADLRRKSCVTSDCYWYSLLYRCQCLHPRKSSTVRFDAKFDGKDYSSSGDDGFDSVSLHQINEREFTLTFKKAGKAVGKNHVSVSRDGRTTTVTQIYNSEAKSGEKKHVDIYEKQ